MFQPILSTTQKLTLALALILFALSQVVMAGEPVSEGSWKKFKANTKGTWHISMEGDKRYINFDKQFKTRKAPDLKVVFSPKPLEDITNRNALDGSVIISLLTDYAGSQRFEIPPHIDLSEYQSLLIHCEKFTYVWSGGKL